MPERKDLTGKDEERQVRSRKGPSTQSRSEKKRRSTSGSGANAARSIPKVGKRDPSRGETSGDGLH